MAKFDMGEFAKTLQQTNVSDSDTGREQIEYIDIDCLDDDPNNFYALSGLEELAANIELCGLQQPIRVRTNPEAAGRFFIVSGHRRRAAVRLLVDSGRQELRNLPCIRERTADSAALQELKLICANSDSRKLTSAEISRQAERVEKLLYQLKEEGYEFPGRMRDYVADACRVSRTKLARLKVIRDKLDPCWQLSYENGELGEATAYALAQIPAEHQRVIFNSWKDRDKPPRQLYENMVKTFGERLAGIDQVECEQCGGNCSNLLGKRHKVLCTDSWTYIPCGNICCAKCDNLTHCKDACHLLSDQVKQLKANASAQRKREKMAREEVERPIISEIREFWHRFGEARNAAKKTVEECYKTLNMCWAHTDDEKVINLECLEAKFDTNTPMPYGYNFQLSAVRRLVGIADLLGCSLDYLFCRTDNPQGMVDAAPAEGWVPLQYLPSKERPFKDGQLAVGKFMAPGMDTPIRAIVKWNAYSKQWEFPSGGDIEAKCVGWFPLPKDDGDTDGAS